MQQNCRLVYGRRRNGSGTRWTDGGGGDRGIMRYFRSRLAVGTHITEQVVIAFDR